jgi:hypothetical protein
MTARAAINLPAALKPCTNALEATKRTLVMSRRSERSCFIENLSFRPRPDLERGTRRGDHGLDQTRRDVVDVPGDTDPSGDGRCRRTPAATRP